MKKLMGLLLGFFALNLVSANYNLTGTVPGIMWGGSSGYGTMSGGIFGTVMYLLIVTNLFFLAVFLYRKIWGKNEENITNQNNKSEENITNQNNKNEENITNQNNKKE